MNPKENESLKDFCITQASTVVFTFNTVYAGLQNTLQSDADAVKVATELTVNALNA